MCTKTTERKKYFHMIFITTDYETRQVYFYHYRNEAGLQDVIKKAQQNSKYIDGLHKYMSIEEIDFIPGDIQHDIKEGIEFESLEEYIENAKKIKKSL